MYKYSAFVSYSFPVSLKSTLRRQRHNREDNEYEHCIVSQNYSFTIRQIRNSNIYLSFKVGRRTLSQGAACPAGRCGVEAYTILAALNLGCMLSFISYSFTILVRQMALDLSSPKVGVTLPVVPRGFGAYRYAPGPAVPGRCGVGAYTILAALHLGCMLSLISYSFTLGQVTLIVCHGRHHNIISQGAQSQCHRNWGEPDQESPTCSSGRSHFYSRL